MIAGPPAEYAELVCLGVGEYRPALAIRLAPVIDKPGTYLQEAVESRRPAAHRVEGIRVPGS